MGYGWETFLDMPIILLCPFWLHQPAEFLAQNYLLKLGSVAAVGQVEMSHNLDPPEPSEHDPYGRQGEGFKIGECQLLHPDEPSCCYRVSWFRRNGAIEITLVVMRFGRWHEPLFCTILKVSEDFVTQNAAKDTVWDVDFFEGHGITDRVETEEVRSKLGQFTRKGGNSGTPLKELPEVFQMVLDLKGLISETETGTAYRIYNFHPDLFVHGMFSAVCVDFFGGVSCFLATDGWHMLHKAGLHAVHSVIPLSYQCPVQLPRSSLKCSILKCRAVESGSLG